MPNPVSFRYFKTSPEIIQLAVMLSERFPLSSNNEEVLPYEHVAALTELGSLNTSLIARSVGF